jgi:hypothetical protein
MFNLIAHAGEVHTTVERAIKHSSENTPIMWAILLLVPFLIAFVAHSALKLKVSSTLLLLSLFLIGFSVYSYVTPGAYTAISLVTGFAIVFTLTFIGLVAKE